MQQNNNSKAANSCGKCREEARDERWETTDETTRMRCTCTLPTSPSMPPLTFTHTTPLFPHPQHTSPSLETITRRARRAENTGLFGPSFLRDTCETRHGEMRSTETDSKSSVHESSRWAKRLTNLSSLSAFWGGGEASIQALSTPGQRFWNVSMRPGWILHSQHKHF